MTLLENVAIEDLFLAMNKTSLDEITPLLNPTAKNSLTQYIARYPVETFKHKKSQSLLASFTEGPSLPYYLLGIILGTIGLAFIPLLIYLGIFTAFMFAVGGIHSVGTYKETCEQEQENIENMQFMMFRLACANEIRRRLKIELRKQGIKPPSLIPKIHTPGAGITKQNQPQPVVANLDDNADEKARLLIQPNNKTSTTKASSAYPAIKDSVAPAMVMGIMIAESFLIPLILIAKLCALSVLFSLITNPIGLGVILLLTVSFCGYLGYKHYQHNKQKRSFRNKANALEQKLIKRHDECYELKETLEQHQSHTKKLHSRLLPKRKLSQKQPSEVKLHFNTKRFRPTFRTNPSVFFKKPVRFFYKMRSGLNSKREYVTQRP